MKRGMGVIQLLDTYMVTLHRYVGQTRVTGYYLGYPYTSVVVVENSLTLEANTEQQLASMVEVAAVDGWRE